MFDNILGNEKNKKILEQAIKNQKLSHSYMMVGTEGIGKKLLAIEFTKIILCNNKDDSCCNCKSCIEFDSKNHPDYIYIEPEGNNIKIEQIRELQKQVQEKPIISKYKVVIINDADSMTKEAQNCLLKTLEEPPKFAIIILIGSNENAFLTTIKSRCTIFHFQPIKEENLKTYLKNNMQIAEITEDMLELFQGSIGKAISLKNKLEQYKKIEELIKNIPQKNIIEIIKQAEVLYQSKEEIFEMLNYINIILLKKAKTEMKYTNCIQIVENTKKRLKQNANYDMTIDNLLFNIWEEIN